MTREYSPVYQRIVNTAKFAPEQGYFTQGYWRLNMPIGGQGID